ncbi:tachylectin-related carbohydrate-binding protein [Streptomyces cavernicola]|uniref:Tachylectin-related carbohydrate-binding protein n=1 Tax=Streptomyces cavernicola TaxID=3043613 RepID=A0ABT6S7A1_9ACTN|nr:tachylectin-related carbohydrate-binding protein [Streptomyces sp. B-S-A6]MDI3403982.1 tachylectin-related carbohydrate-binding protein [Streptomyces sp. B-S-A6]
MPQSDRSRRRTTRSVWTVLAALVIPFIAPSTPAQADTACTTPSVSNYHVDDEGQLRRWTYTAPLTGDATWQQTSIAPSWSAAKTISGGDGVLFTITPSGALRWHKDNNYNGVGGASWHTSSGATIGTDWSEFTTVVAGGDGVLYAVDSNGRLYWYRYLGTAGEFSWANGGVGRLLGTGWGTFPRIAAGGNGILYAVTSTGQLRWYRHLSPTGGNASWANGGIGTTVGTGWGGFTKLVSFGAGVLLGRNSTGTVNWYRHLDPLTGTGTWANNGVGLPQGTGWNDNEIVADVSGCRIT